MRNPVARYDFNRSSTHEDKKRSWEPDVEGGYCEWLAETSDGISEGLISRMELQELSLYMLNSLKDQMGEE